MPDRTGVSITGAGVDVPGGQGLEAFWHRALHAPTGPDGRRAPAPAYTAADRAALLTRVTDEALDRAALPRCAGRRAAVIVCAQAASPGPAAPPFLADPVPAGLHRVLGGGRPTVLSNACASGGFAVHLAGQLLRSRLADAAVVLGSRVEDPLEELSLRAVRALTVSSARPFDSRRDGMALGSGGAALVLERTADALARGVRPLASVPASACLVRPGRADTDHEAITACVRRAVRDEDSDGDGWIDAVIAHATGTFAGDATELAALAEVGAGRGWQAVPITSNKGSLGHLLHASALVSIVHAVLALERGIVPGTFGCADAVDAGPAVEVARTTRTAAPLRRILVNAFGFGGNYSTVQLEQA